MSIDTITETTIDETTQADLAKIEQDVTTKTTLADLIRKGSENTTQEFGGWGQGDRACALSAAGLAAQELGIIG